MLPRLLELPNLFYRVKIMQPRWQPTADLDILRTRAAIIDNIRAFFKQRNVLEVETPLLSHATVTDPHIHSFATFLAHPGGRQASKLYLQTSPEFAMKRLLAAGIGSIYQICKAFRNEESGRLHNPEFTMLEWYRPLFDHHQLMDEMDEFLSCILQTSKAKRLSYRQLFLDYLNIDPHQATVLELKQIGEMFGLAISAPIFDRDTWLQLLMSHLIEPKLTGEQPIFVYDFPKSQAALARIRDEEPPVAERFEVFVNGLEIANGYHELIDANEQRKRFRQDLQQRTKLQSEEVVQDERLLLALANGFPNCAGVAVGVDRLIMLAVEKNYLAEVIAFPVEYA